MSHGQMPGDLGDADERGDRLGKSTGGMMLPSLLHQPPGLGQGIVHCCAVSRSAPPAQPVGLVICGDTPILIRSLPPIEPSKQRSCCVSSITGMTVSTKSLAKDAGKVRVEPNENVWVNVDILMTHDVCGPGTIGIFHEKFGRDAKVWDRERVVVIPDHYIFTADQKCHRNVQ